MPGFLTSLNETGGLRLNAVLQMSGAVVVPASRCKRMVRRCKERAIGDQLRHDLGINNHFLLGLDTSLSFRSKRSTLL